MTFSAGIIREVSSTKQKKNLGCTGGIVPHYDFSSG